MALRIPLDDRPLRINLPLHINFTDACHLICQLEPALDILAVAEALKMAIAKKTLPVENVPTLYIKSAQFLLLDFNREVLFSPGVLFAPMMLNLERVLSVFAEGKKEVAAALERSKSILAGWSDQSAPESQTADIEVPATATTPQKAKRKTGRPAEHDWNGAREFALRYFAEHPLPKIKARAIELVANWFTKHDGPKVPDEREIDRKVVAELYAGK